MVGGVIVVALAAALVLATLAVAAGTSAEPARRVA
jgi:hypothetical protein